VSRPMVDPPAPPAVDPSLARVDLDAEARYYDAVRQGDTAAAARAFSAWAAARSNLIMAELAAGTRPSPATDVEVAR
jgi:hypothetical protein